MRLLFKVMYSAPVSRRHIWQAYSRPQTLNQNKIPLPISLLTFVNFSISIVVDNVHQLSGTPSVFSLHGKEVFQIPRKSVVSGGTTARLETTNFCELLHGSSISSNFVVLADTCSDPSLGEPTAATFGHALDKIDVSSFQLRRETLRCSSVYLKLDYLQYFSRP